MSDFIDPDAFFEATGADPGMFQPTQKPPRPEDLTYPQAVRLYRECVGAGDRATAARLLSYWIEREP